MRNKKKKIISATLLEFKREESQFPSNLFGGIRLRNKIAFCTLALSIILLLPFSGFAANDQGLTWGVEVDDRKEYSFRYEDVNNPEYSFLHEFYLVVESLPQIPNNISYASPLNFGVFPELGFYYLNGSEADNWYQFLPQMIIPTGNWTLWTKLFEAIEPTSEGMEVTVEVANDPSVWSYSINTTVDDHSEEGECSYIKGTGIISDFLWSAYLEGEKYVEFEVHLLGGGIATEVLLAIGGVGILAVLVIVLLVRKKG